MTTLADILPVDRPALLTTAGPEGPRTRPIGIHPDPHGDEGVVAIVTTETTRKVADIAAQPMVVLSGTTDDGYYAIEARAERVDDTAAIGRTMAHFLGGAGTAPADDAAPAEQEQEQDEERPATVLYRLHPTSATLWTVHSPRPFDNDVENIAV